LSLCACRHAIAEPPVEVLLAHEIDAMAAEDARELFLDIEDAETDHPAGLEVDEDINVAVWPEIVRQDGAEEGEFADVMPPAELSDSSAIDRNLGRHTSTHTTFRAQAGTSRILRQHPYQWTAGRSPDWAASRASELRYQGRSSRSAVGFFEDFFDGNKRAVRTFWRVVNDQLTATAAR
jgi:hypothetical protein